MAYYTIAHVLQARDSFNGKQLGSANIHPSQLANEVWDYIFFPEKSYPLSSTDISHSTLDHLRNEFQYWYPINLHSSEKDLISNHLIYSLCNHIVIWPNHSEYWPRSFRNFITLLEAIEKFSADGIRLVLATHVVNTGSFFPVNRGICLSSGKLH
ncbi:unnamed protein product [Rotaria sp. Silwood2]|nr:unnamed protein product [Rotaria sp. Silwood2]CAF3223169.1 unnamed protein product [Rotaria sp. Silwood2]CAF3499683.1 unnamed protein product [Rotaria sp. Silwood2]CAF4592814.1 unnamed protein product [Rotaria sp. Silwood2]CAF4664154.1 unnamed protein product [Rotaria sp. Silwood2]